jgi:hypothetical protein
MPLARFSPVKPQQWVIQSPALGQRPANARIGRIADVRKCGVGGRDSGPLSEQISLRGALLPLRGAAAPEYGHKVGVYYPALHLVRRQPVGVEFDAKIGAAARAPYLAITSLECSYQIASWLDHARKLAEGDWPIGRREEHERVPADHASQRRVFEGQFAQVGFGLGPVAGGTLLSFAGWSSVFWVNVPVAAIGIALTAVAVRESRNARARRLDRPGVVLSAPGSGRAHPGPGRGLVAPVGLAAGGRAASRRCRPPDLLRPLGAPQP